jgi:hypothetical protein
MVFVMRQLAERFFKEFLFSYLCQPDDDTPGRDILYKIAHTRTKKCGLEIFGAAGGLLCGLSKVSNVDDLNV